MIADHQDKSRQHTDNWQFDPRVDGKWRDPVLHKKYQRNMDHVHPVGSIGEVSQQRARSTEPAREYPDRCKNHQPCIRRLDQDDHRPWAGDLLAEVKPTGIQHQAASRHHDQSEDSTGGASLSVLFRGRVGVVGVKRQRSKTKENAIIKQD